MARIPGFGGWDDGDNVQYTVCFENAREGRGGGTPKPSFNPSAPQDSPSAFPGDRGPHNNNVHRKSPPTGGPSGGHHRYERKVQQQSNQHRPAPSPPKTATPQRGPALPGFGQWDDSPPGGFTAIFDQVRDARKSPAPKMAPAPDNKINYAGHGNHQNKDASNSCFGCLFGR